MTGLSPVQSLFPILVGLQAAARNSCYRNLKERLPWMQQARKDNNGVLVDFTFPAHFQLEAQAMGLWLEDNITCYCPFPKVVHWQPLLCMLSLCCEQCDDPAKFRCFALLDLFNAKLRCFFFFLILRFCNGWTKGVNWDLQAAQTKNRKHQQTKQKYKVITKCAAKRTKQKRKVCIRISM